MTPARVPPWVRPTAPPSGSTTFCQTHAAPAARAPGSGLGLGLGLARRVGRRSPCRATRRPLLSSGRASGTGCTPGSGLGLDPLPSTLSGGSSSIMRSTTLAHQASYSKGVSLGRT
eukprot:scaffold92667_cov58-Phaeocystis_antarctica.AAC.3